MSNPVNKWPQEKEDELRAHALAGLSEAQTARKMKISRGSVCGKAGRLGVKFKHSNGQIPQIKREWSPEQIQMLRDAPAAGLTQVQLVAMTGFPIHTVKKKLERLGIKLGQKGWGGVKPGQPAKPRAVGFDFTRKPENVTPPVRGYVEAPGPNAAILLDLAPHQCHWPVGDSPVGHMDGQLMCGDHADGTYCDRHRAMVYRGFSEPSSRVWTPDRIRRAA